MEICNNRAGARALLNRCCALAGLILNQCCATRCFATQSALLAHSLMRPNVRTLAMRPSLLDAAQQVQGHVGATTPPWERRPHISRFRFFMGEPRSRLPHFHFMCIAVSKSLVAGESIYLGFLSINVRITSPISIMLVPFGMHLSNQKDAWATVRIKNKHLSSFCSQSLSNSRAV